MSAFDKFDRGMNENDNTLSWITSYNFVCLINIPQVIREFGPVHNLWEGGGQGEKIISFFKPVWFGFRNNWQANMLESILKRMAIKRVCNDTKYDEIYDKEEITDEVISGFPCFFHSYSGVDSMMSKYNSRQPLSIFRLNDNSFACVVQKKHFIPLNCSEMQETVAGSSYFFWTVAHPFDTNL